MSKVEEKLDNLVEKIIAKLDEGVLPWRTSKNSLNDNVHVSCRPANVVSLEPYTGKNYFVTLFNLCLNQWSSGWFGTFLQWQANDCKVKKGEKSTNIMRWFSRQVIDPYTGSQTTEEGHRWYSVFNIDQVEPVSPKGETYLSVNKTAVVNPVHLDKVTNRLIDPAGNPYYRVALFDDIPNLLGFNFEEKEDPDFDLRFDHKNEKVIMPPMEEFDNSATYYSTLFQGAVLAIGKRLGRVDDNNRNVAVTSREHLVADLASVYLMDILGLEKTDNKNVSEFLPNWSRYLKADKKNLMSVINDATKATKYILDKIGLNNKDSEEKVENATKETVNA